MFFLLLTDVSWGGGLFSDFRRNPGPAKNTSLKTSQKGQTDSTRKFKMSVKVAKTTATSEGVTASVSARLQDGQLIALLDKVSKKYFSARAELANALVADAAGVGPLERFQVISKGGGKVSLQADNGSYLVVDTLNPANPVKSGLVALDAYGTFDVSDGEGETVFFRACNGKYLTVVDGQVRATSKEPVGLVCKIQPPPAALPFSTFRSKAGLKCAYQRDHKSVLGVGKTYDGIAIGRPGLPPGWVFFGDIMVIGTDMAKAPALVIEDVPSSDLLRKPKKLELYWHETDTKKPQVSLWTPVPEPGYVAMGMVAAMGNKSPDDLLATLRCVKADQVKPGRSSQVVWRNTGAAGLSLFAVTRAANDPDGIVPGTFLSANYNYGLQGVSGGTPFELMAPDPDGYLAGVVYRCDTYRLVGIQPIFSRFSNRKDLKEGPFFKPCSEDGKNAWEKCINNGHEMAIGGWGCLWGPGFVIDFAPVFMKFLGKENRLDSATSREERWTRPKTPAGATNSFMTSTSGLLFRGIVGRADQAGFHSIGLVPIPSQEAWVLKGMTPDDVHKDVFEGMKDSLVQDQQPQIEQDSLVQFGKEFPKISQAAKESRPSNQADAKAGEIASITADFAEIRDQKSQTLGTPEKDQLTGGPATEASAASVETPKASEFSAFRSAREKFEKAGKDAKLEDFPGLENAACVKGAPLTNPKFISGSTWCALLGQTKVNFEEFGEVEGDFVALAREDKKEGVRCALAVFTSADELKSKVGIFEKEPLDTMIFTGAAVAYAPKAHSWEFKDLPPDVQSLWKSKTGVDDGELKFAEKTAAIFGIPFHSVPVLSEILEIYLTDVKTALAYAVKPLDESERYKCVIDFNTSYIIGNLLPGLKLSKPGLELHLGGIALLGELQLRLSSSIEFDLPVRMDVPFSKATCLKQGVNLSALIPGEWKNPMGVPGLTVKEMVLAGGLGGSAPYLGLKGVFDYGKRLELAGAISPTSPLGIAALSAKTPQWTLNDIIVFYTFLHRAALAQTGVDTPQPDLPLDFIKLKDVYIMISQITNPALGLDRGIIASGQLDIGGQNLGEVKVRIYPTTGIYAYAAIKKIDLGPITLTGAGPDNKNGTDDDCPVFMMQYELAPDSSSILKQQCFINGAINICGAYLEYTQELRSDKMNITIVGKLGNVMAIVLEASSGLSNVFALGGLELKGSVQGLYLNEVQEKVLSAVNTIPYLDVIIGALQNGIFRLDGMSLKGSFDDICKGIIPGLDVRCVIVGQGFTVPIPKIDVRQTPDITRTIVDVLYEKVISQIGDIAGRFAAIMKDTAIKVGEKVAGTATDAANKVRDVAVISGKQIAETASQIGDFSKTSAETLEKGAESALSKCQEVVTALLDSFEDIGDAIEDAWDSIFG